MSTRSYWWVNQGKAYEIQKSGSFLWSPKVEKDGGANKGFSNMLDAKIGDVFFVNYKSSIAAVGIIKAEAIESERPLDFPEDQNSFSKIGWRIDADYFEIPEEDRVSISELIGVFHDTPAIKSPFGADNKAKQKLYLNDLMESDGEKILRNLILPEAFPFRVEANDMAKNDFGQKKSLDRNFFIGRITWNDNLWQKPSGPKINHEAEENFTSEYGYGHEEWLFSNRFLFEDYAYGFIEGASRKKREDFGKTVNVMLYTVSKSMGWYFVGEIDECEILTEEDAQRAVDYFLKSGAIKEMIQDVENVGGNPIMLSSQANGPRSLFCVRFKPDKLTIYERPQVIKTSSFIRGKYNRYHLNEVSEEILFKELELYRSENLKVINGKRTISAKEIALNYKHNEMQNELLVILRKKYKKVTPEFRNIDLFIEDEKDYIIEIKTSDSARLCIREALGQLLEYSFYFEKYNNPQLIIVGPVKMQNEDFRYVNKLNELIGVRIHYCHYEVGSNKFNYTF